MSGIRELLVVFYRADEFAWKRRFACLAYGMRITETALLVIERTPPILNRDTLQYFVDANYLDNLGVPPPKSKVIL